MKESLNINDFSYRMSQFNKKDYLVLYRMTTNVNLKRKLKDAIFRDKKVQRILSFSTFEEINIFYGDFDKLGLYINVGNEIAQEILKWRLAINK
jgi:protein-arginine kinase